MVEFPREFQEELALIDMSRVPTVLNCMMSAGAHVLSDGTQEKIILFQFITEYDSLIEFTVPVSSPLGVALVSGAFSDRVQDRLKD